MKLKLTQWGLNEYNWELEKIVEFDNFEDAVKNYTENYDWDDYDGGPYDGQTTEVYIRDIENDITQKYEIKLKINPTFTIRRIK